MKDGTRALENACKEFEADLVLYYYGDDSADNHGRVEQHCDECSRCQRFLEDLRQLLPRMAQPKELPATFWDNYYNETVQKLRHQQQQSSWWRQFFAPVSGWALPAFGTLAVATLAFFLVFGSGWHQKRSTPAIPQEILSDPRSVEFFNSMDLLEFLGKLEQSDGSHIDVSATVRHT